MHQRAKRVVVCFRSEFGRSEVVRRAVNGRDEAVLRRIKLDCAARAKARVKAEREKVLREAKRTKF